jgi:hypothetical protein
MRKSLVAIGTVGALLAVAGLGLLTGQSAVAKPCPTPDGAWKGTVTVTTPAGPRTFESRLMFADGAVSEITSAPRQDPATGVFQMTSGLGAYAHDCYAVRFTFTKYHHGADGALLEIRTIAETGQLTSENSYAGSATVHRLRPDGTPMTDPAGNPIVLSATSSYTRVQP